eukprot:1159908-Pelagomonas_calceolata.AAC.2
MRKESPCKASAHVAASRQEAAPTQEAALGPQGVVEEEEPEGTGECPKRGQCWKHVAVPVSNVQHWRNGIVGSTWTQQACAEVRTLTRTTYAEGTRSFAAFQALRVGLEGTLQG